jgi:DNA-nicking Smr family endonuclease
MICFVPRRQFPVVLVYYSPVVSEQQIWYNTPAVHKASFCVDQGYAMSSKNATFSVRPFEKLKKKIASKNAVSPPTPARQKKKVQLTDEELFSHAMDEVEVIDEFRSLACAHRPKKRASHAGKVDPDQEALTILEEIAEGHRPIHLPDTQEYVEWKNPDSRDDIVQILHSGHFSIQSFLDLHGCTVPEAEEELEEFFQESFKKGLRCVKVIHGRGLRSTRGARIKDAVVRRLSGHFRKDIIAYVSARQCDGGLGALYVLLKKK